MELWVLVLLVVIINIYIFCHKVNTRLHVKTNSDKICLEFNTWPRCKSLMLVEG